MRKQSDRIDVKLFFCFLFLVTVDFRPLIFGQNDGNALKSVGKKEREGLREKKIADDFTQGYHTIYLISLELFYCFLLCYRSVDGAFKCYFICAL